MLTGVVSRMTISVTSCLDERESDTVLTDEGLTWEEHGLAEVVVRDSCLAPASCG